MDVYGYMVRFLVGKWAPQICQSSFFARQVSGDRQELDKLSDEVLKQGGDHLDCRVGDKMSWSLDWSFKIDISYMIVIGQL